MLSFLRNLGKSLGTLLLAFLLAIIVWVSAVTSNDPNIEQELTRPVTLEIIGLDTGLVITSQNQSQVRIWLQAPRSVWTQINSSEGNARAWVDLSALQAGEHSVPIQIQVKVRPVRVIRIAPLQVEIKLEKLVSQNFPISLDVIGKTALGYTAEAPILDPSEVNISGPLSLVTRIKEVRANLNIADANETIKTTLSLVAQDEKGAVVRDITISPPTVSVSQPIHLLGGYRNVIVKVNTTGHVANGYKLTNLLTNPPNVVVFSADPQKVNALPGYIETKVLSLDNAADDFEAWVELNLPEGIRAVEDTKVLVTISIAAIETTINITLPVEITGLSPTMLVVVAPTTMDLVLSGPVPVLSKLKPSEVRVKLDLTDYLPGDYHLVPTVEFLPDRVVLASVNPSDVEVKIVLAPTATPTPTITPTPTPTPTPLETPTPTPTPTSTLAKP